MHTPYGWEIMNDEEKVDHLLNLEERILEHRYRYYILDAPVIPDTHYDYLERYYVNVCSLLGVEPTVTNMVDYNHGYPGAKEAAERVLAGLDNYSLNLKERLSKS